MSDLQKPPVRMWLFGMITLLEMRTTRLIELKCPGDSWKQYLSESRLQKAEALLEERKRRNQNLELIDCLQISDKGQIIARNEEIRRLTRMQSRRQTEQAIKMLESLRNNLAHSQDIISCDWETIVGCARIWSGSSAGPRRFSRPLRSNSVCNGSVTAKEAGFVPERSWLRFPMQILVCLRLHRYPLTNLDE